MKLTFEQTEEDVLDLSKHTLKSNQFLKIFGIIFLVIIITSLISVDPNETDYVTMLISWLLPIIIMILMWVIFSKILIKKSILMFGNKKLMTGKREIEILEDKVKILTSMSEGSYSWSAITELKQSDINYFLFISKRQAIIVSKSAFEDEAQKSAFEELVNAKISHQTK